MKLLAKTAEERYQTAAGLERDLRRCLAQFEVDGRIEDFALGEGDTPDRLLIPEKLYGREHEIEILLAAFERVVRGAAPELVLVSGYSGIGKSAVVNELHKVLVPPRGLFAAGKFDQYKRDIPYATLSEAFQTLVHSLLTKSDAELNDWRESLREALGPNGQLMVELVPELRLIIGDQAPVPELSPQDAQRRFQLVFRRFVAVFARAEHPLALFLDDLQWLDAATLDVLEDLLTHPDVRHVLLIGVYRDNEVTSAHPLTRTLNTIRKSGALVREIALAPLDREDVGHLIADSLHCEREAAAQFAGLVHEKTGGNPFFVIQFLTTLVEEGLVTFDYSATRWFWDLARIHSKEYTDNVVDLLVSKLSRLSVRTQTVLQRLACLGNVGESATLAQAQEDSEAGIHAALWEAVHAGFVFQTDGTYKFLHDRVQEAAYALIPIEKRPAAHLKVGRILLAQTPTEKLEEAIFEITNQLNRGAAMITAEHEREQVAGLNLIAARRAKAATAYASALRYLDAGSTLLAEDCWERCHALMFGLELNRAECEFLTSQSAAAEERLTALSSRAKNTVELATLTCLRMDLYTTLGRSDRAVDVCIDYLKHLGVDWSPHPADDEVEREYARIWLRLASRAIEELIELPLMRDAVALATLDVLTKAAPPAHFTDKNLSSLVICRMVNLSIEYGNSDGSCIAYVYLGMIAGPHFGNYDAAFRFGRLGYELVESRGLRRFQARSYMCFASHIVPWAKHIDACRELIGRTFEVANKMHDLTFAAYSCNNVNTIRLVAGDRLAEVESEAGNGLKFAREAGFGMVIDIVTTQLALIRTLRGSTRQFGCFDDGQFNELQFERHLSSNSSLAFAEFFYWVRKLQARFFAEDHVGAIAAASRAEELIWTSPSQFETAELCFYGALAHAASCDGASPIQYAQHVEALTAYRKQLVQWREHCPENFQNRTLLVEAELARLEGRKLDAEGLYEEAIRSARENGFVHNEALANELAARFYAARGLETISHAYLRNARYGYFRWGADGKVRQLDQLHPHLRTEERGAGRTDTVGGLVEQLDLATVIKVSQAVSGEMVFEKLLDTLMRTAMEHAGAQRALLVLSREGEQRIAAEATTNGDAVFVQLRDEPVTGGMLPETILHYVLHTHESVILDDAANRNPFSTDPYVRQHHARSVLCLPLWNRAKLLGGLYLENNLTSHVFAPARAAVLKLLASQAAISLENTRLYRDLAERESRIRRLVDSNIIGIFIWELDGRILETNDAFLTMVGYDREDLLTGSLRWTDLTPQEWRARDEQLAVELKASGILQPFEKEYFRKDGSRVPVLVGIASFEETGRQGVAYVVDLTERKRAQQALNRASAELAHVSRVTALSALTASIAHEVNQPLSGIITNAGTCLRMLDATPANIDGARETARRTIRDGNRASEVIARLRALFSKREFTLESVDLNEAVREVIALSSNDLQQSSILLQVELADGLPPVTGDRIQLQQVVLNLLRNASDAMVDVHDRQRQLLIKTEREDGDGVRLSVRDAGAGLPPESLDSLFDPFYTTKSGGMGIGLFVSRSIVERHQGRLWAEPNHGGPGATFSLSIPIDQLS
jgi:PAS domain S-box-containing protein